MPKYQLIWWQSEPSDMKEGESFEAKSLEEAQALVLEGQGLRIDEVKETEKE